jgi:hypothetical protein
MVRLLNDVTAVPPEKWSLNMTYAECRDAALKLLNQYSIGGELIASSYNNQYDYLKRIPELINSAMLLIATTVLSLEAVYEPAETTSLKNGWLAFDMPQDFIRLTSRGLMRLNGETLSFVKDYRMISSTKMAISPELFAETLITYCRTPARLSLASPETTVLDLPDYAAAALPYYVAAHLSLGEDNFIYANLLNEFEARLERLRLRAESETEITIDDYGLSGAYGVY